ncbi:hypothetical protein NLU13_1338 [Sarocladium strictum]|uniref:Uncharacterized protein n=1 Tax=Sarocladium strictum TaxID=5046 RepID=A0AA39GSR2_SARSR|nr:hypothetical protein NLU13_1338 [Sarocladium strictum]
MLVFRDINAAKTHLMRMRNPVDEKRWRTEAENVDRADYLLAKLKASIAVIHYLNRVTTPNANGKLATIVNNIGYQLAYAQQLWNKVAILQFWREWVKDLFEVALINQTRKFVEGLIKEMRLAWAPRSGETAKKVLETVEIMEAELEHLSIDTSNFH